MGAYHCGKGILLVFLLQEDECICEKQRQDIYGSEEKQEITS